MKFFTTTVSIIIVSFVACVYSLEDDGDAHQQGALEQKPKDRSKMLDKILTTGNNNRITPSSKRGPKSLVKRSALSTLLAAALGENGSLNMTAVRVIAEAVLPPPAPEEVDCHIPVTEYIGGSCIHWQYTGRTACQSGVRTELFNDECLERYVYSRRP